MRIRQGARAPGLLTNPRKEHRMTPTNTPFQLGDPVTHRGIVVTPLFPARDPRASYITLDEALPRGLVITETSDAGSVPELAVVNPLDDNVLLYDGEELVGAKQNRILNVSVLVGAGAKLPIPVSCVEQGRWARVVRRLRHRDAHLARSSPPPQGRDALGAAARPRRRAERGVGRDRREAAADVASPRPPAPPATRSSRTATASRSSRTPSRCSRASAAPCSRSAVTSASTPSRGPDAFALLWPKLRAGYLLDALERLDRQPDPQGADRRLRRRDRRRGRQPAAPPPASAATCGCAAPA